MKIWVRYLVQHTLFLFLALICSFYTLYVLIDYSTNASLFHQKENPFSLFEIALYYGAEFSKRADILIPFALMIAAIRTVTLFNQRFELTALRASGVSLSRIMLPFVCLGLFFTALLYINHEWILPHSFQALKKLEKAHPRIKKIVKEQSSLPEALKLTELEDNSLLLYKRFNNDFMRYEEVFWIVSPNSFYFMKDLYPFEKPALGNTVIHFERNEKGELIPSLPMAQKSFDTLHLTAHQLDNTRMQPEEMSLLTLFKASRFLDGEYFTKEAELLTAFYSRLSSPWLALLALLCTLPYCFVFRRGFSTFVIYTLSLIGLLSFYLCIESLEVVSKRQVLEPGISLILPFILLAIFATFSLKRVYRS